MLGGHLDFGTMTGAYAPHVRAGKLRLVAIGAGERINDFPDVPTLREVGFDYIALSYQGVMGPKGLPEPIAKKLKDVFKKARNEPSYVEFEKKLLLVPTNETRKAFERRMIENYRNIGKYLKKE
jgi:tripartite-type tricarboxylate transporter receptor subunit TctC